MDNPFEMYTTALYAQDQWTVGRLTLQGGIRFEHIGSWSRSSIPVAPVFSTASDLPGAGRRSSPKDINPRFGGAYDVFGSGKTSLKASLGRYPTADNSYGAYGFLQQPAFRVATNTARGWNDTSLPGRRPAPGNYRPDCDLTNPGGPRRVRPWQPELRQAARSRPTIPTC